MPLNKNYSDPIISKMPRHIKGSGPDFSPQIIQYPLPAFKNANKTPKSPFYPKGVQRTQVKSGVNNFYLIRWTTQKGEKFLNESGKFLSLQNWTKYDKSCSLIPKDKWRQNSLELHNFLIVRMNAR